MNFIHIGESGSAGLWPRFPSPVRELIREALPVGTFTGPVQAVSAAAFRSLPLALRFRVHHGFWRLLLWDVDVGDDFSRRLHGLDP